MKKLYSLVLKRCDAPDLRPTKEYSFHCYFLFLRSRISHYKITKTLLKLQNKFSPHFRVFTERNKQPFPFLKFPLHVIAKFFDTNFAHVRRFAVIFNSVKPSGGKSDICTNPQELAVYVLIADKVEFLLWQVNEVRQVSIHPPVE